jgi:hypothetical protein
MKPRVDAAIAGDLLFEGLHMATALENCAPIDVEEADAGVSMHRCCCGRPRRCYTRGPRVCDEIRGFCTDQRCSKQFFIALSQIISAFGKRMQDLVVAST